ncbi:sugar ABC transporter ATP-binding protein [Devosia sp.]|uniref:sugar ABC transporter ATP-binding protein n=1 Tax=Devosia sp. TaxID=1871048 RepID=UPI002EF9BE7F
MHRGEDSPLHADEVPDVLLEMRGIGKSFPGIRALQQVTFSVRAGEVHGLVGENGAGKSTLMKILSGAYQADEGSITLNHERMQRTDPQAMIERGVAVIYQEFAQAPHLTVAENIFMNRPRRTRAGLVDWAGMAAEAARHMERLGFSVDPRRVIGELSVAQRQMVEIARAISRDARLIVLDEPSAVLGDAELEKLFGTIRALQRDGVSFIYISHRLKEVFDICQSVTVLRDGQLVASRPIEEWTTDSLIRSMVGREMGDYFPPRRPSFGDEVLRVEGLGRAGVLHDISFSLRAGEILGVCGLAGAGRSELLRAIVGADRLDRGSISLRGKPTRIDSPRKAISLGIGFAPEDRKTEGLFLDQTVKFNVTISKLKDYLRGFWLDVAREKQSVSEHVRRLGVKAPSIDEPVGNLSGGNQQKCVLAKQINARCEILLVDEPTRGVDVGAKREIYDLLVELTQAKGLAVLMVSSELPEIMGMCDRILVMREGRITAELPGGSATEEQIMTCATIH